MSVHEGIKLYCHICVKSFAGRHTLNSHLRTVHADKPQAFKCKHCKNDSFLSRRGLLQHITSVHIQRKFQCTLCDKRFFKEINLKTHISVTHEGLKRFLCTICGRHFTENGKLRKHLEVQISSYDVSYTVFDFISVRICFISLESKKILSIDKSNNLFL